MCLSHHGETVVHIVSGQRWDYFITFPNQGHVNQPRSVFQNNMTIGLSGALERAVERCHKLKLQATFQIQTH